MAFKLLVLIDLVGNLDNQDKFCRGSITSIKRGEFCKSKMQRNYLNYSSL